MKFIDPSQDPWRPLPDGVLAAATLHTRDHRLLTLAQWQELPPGWVSAHAGAATLGLLLPNDANECALQADLPRLSLVALQFPKWTDGRAYSQARTLRSRLAFGGEIRATGEVLVDMLPLLQRTGFDAVQLRADQRLDSALRALRFFGAHYQGDVTEPRPAFRREALAA